MVRKIVGVVAAIAVSVLLDASAYGQLGGSGSTLGKDPGRPNFGLRDPARSSIEANGDLLDAFKAQGNRFETNSDRRQWRAKRPEPGYSEINPYSKDLSSFTTEDSALSHALQQVRPRGLGRPPAPESPLSK
jgi:hypothetical protein